MIVIFFYIFTKIIYKVLIYKPRFLAEQRQEFAPHLRSILSVEFQNLWQLVKQKALKKQRQTLEHNCIKPM